MPKPAAMACMGKSRRRGFPYHGNHDSLCFALPMHVLQVRAFAGWPGTTATFYLEAAAGEHEKDVMVKIIRTCVAEQTEAETIASTGSLQREVCVTRDRLLVPCAGGGMLEILDLQPPGKKPMHAGAFTNGLKGRRLYIRS